MGILNLTPDSFYDGGKYASVESAIKRGKEIIEEGAHIIDVGAESTRPGSLGISLEDEISRLEPILKGLKKLSAAPVSLDTNKPLVAKRFLKDGLVHMINDVTGLRDPLMVEVAQEYDVPVVMMHMYGTPRTMQADYQYEDIVDDLMTFFEKRIKETGLKKVILDPGIGFGKSVEHNLEIIRRLPEFLRLGFPVMLGISRKFFIGRILGLEPENRLEGSLASLAVAVQNGVSMVRVHDVKESLRTIKIVEAIKNVDYKEVSV